MTHYTISIVISSVALFNLSYSFLNVAVEFITCPFTLFSPTNKHPELSPALFPMCIKIPSKPGTSIKRG